MKGQTFYSKLFCPVDEIEKNEQKYKLAAQGQFYTEYKLVNSFYNHSLLSTIQTEFPIKVTLDDGEHSCRVDTKIVYYDGTERTSEIQGDWHFYGFKHKSGNWSTTEEHRDGWKRVFGKLDKLADEKKYCLVINMLIPGNDPVEEVETKLRQDQRRALNGFFNSRLFVVLMNKLKTTKKHIVVNIQYDDVIYPMFRTTGDKSLDRRVETMTYLPDYKYRISKC